MVPTHEGFTQTRVRDVYTTHLPTYHVLQATARTPGTYQGDSVVFRSAYWYTIILVSKEIKPSLIKIMKQNEH